jgi:hypothetical protein
VAEMRGSGPFINKERVIFHNFSGRECHQAKFFIVG